MNPDHSRFADWDSAYVLGALSPADRREYEEHLETCEVCRRSVAELAPMPGLLARLPAERAEALLDEPAVGASAPRPDLLDAVRREGRRRSIRRAPHPAGVGRGRSVVVLAAYRRAPRTHRAPPPTGRRSRSRRSPTCRCRPRPC